MLRTRILLRLFFVSVMLIGGALPVRAAITLYVIGDTGDCGTDGARKVSAALREQTDWGKAWLLEVGDLAYPVATRERLAECHEPHFGMFARRLAVPGNHDWRDAEGRGFLSLVPAPVPRVVALTDRWRLWLMNSNLRGEAWDAQLRWLEQAVRERADQCIIAAWHHPRWSSGLHGDSGFVGPLWDRLAGVASFTLHGHDHHYEALPALDSVGAIAAMGTRSFIAGNGGAALYPPGRAHASRAVFGQWGFLRIDIEGERYDWRALNVAGEVVDSGTGQCLHASAVPEIRADRR
jgi:hypothetical protein